MKKLTAACLALALFLPWTSCAHAIDIRLNGDKIAMDVPPALQNNRTMISISAVANALGGEATWDQSTREVLVQKSTSTVILKIDSSSATVNGSVVALDAPPVIYKGRTMVPLSFIASAFGEKVRWDSDTQTVFIGSAITDPREIASHPAGQALTSFMSAYRSHNFDTLSLGIKPSDFSLLPSFTGLSQKNSSSFLNQLENITYRIISINEKDGSASIKLYAEFPDLGKAFYQVSTSAQNPLNQWALLNETERTDLINSLMEQGISAAMTAKKVYAEVPISLIHEDGRYIIDLQNSPAFCNILWGNLLSYK